jgi:hypothetical protein
MNKATQEQIIWLETAIEKLHKCIPLNHGDRQTLRMAALSQISGSDVIDPIKKGQLKVAIHKIEKGKLLDETDRPVLLMAALNRVAEYKNGVSHVCEGFAAPDFTCNVCGEML